MNPGAWFSLAGWISIFKAQVNPYTRNYWYCRRQAHRVLIASYSKQRPQRPNYYSNYYPQWCAQRLIEKVSVTSPVPRTSLTTYPVLTDFVRKIKRFEELFKRRIHPALGYLIPQLTRPLRQRLSVTNGLGVGVGITVTTFASA